MKKKITYQRLYELALSISITKNEFLALGLVTTYHALDAATKAIGWEMADIIEGTHPMVELDTMSENEDKDENRKESL